MPWPRVNLKWRERGLWLLALLAACLLWWLSPRAPDAPVGQHVIATPAPQVQTIERVVERPKIVYVYPDTAKEKLKLPEAIRTDRAEKVVASTRVSPDERPHTVTTTLNLESGQFTTLDRAEPLPWLRQDSSGEAGILYGFKNGAPAARLEARQNLIAVKVARVGLVGTLDQDGDWYAGVGVWLRW